MKKLIALLSVLALTVLASCGKTEVVEDTTSTGTTNMEIVVENNDVVEMTEDTEVMEETTSTGTTNMEIVVENNDVVEMTEDTEVMEETTSTGETTSVEVM